MNCPECGAETPDNANFCISCRHNLSLPDSLDDLENTLSVEIPPMPDFFEPGVLFTDRYEILSKGFEGGMGVVYQCKDTKLNMTVALKMIHPRLLNSLKAKERFRREVAISIKLHHPKIVRIHNLEEWEGVEYFTMEWIEGRTLRKIIDERKGENTPFSVEEANNIISQLSDILRYAHKHTIHRDIKPENIMVFDERNLSIKLTDFGIAKMTNPSEFQFDSGKQTGTPYYMAPEQKDNRGNIDKRADIYSVGVVLFELLTLKNTISLTLPSDINKELPKDIDNILRKALEEKSENRYGNVEELSKALEELAISEIKKRNEQEMKVQKQEKIAELLKQGKAYLETRSFEQAIKVFKTISELELKHPEWKKLLARANDQKRREEVIVEMRRQRSTLVEKGESYLKISTSISRHVIATSLTIGLAALTFLWNLSDDMVVVGLIISIIPVIVNIGIGKAKKKELEREKKMQGKREYFHKHRDSVTTLLSFSFQDVNKNDLESTLNDAYEKVMKLYTLAKDITDFDANRGRWDTSLSWNFQAELLFGAFADQLGVNIAKDEMLHIQDDIRKEKMIEIYKGLYRSTTICMDKCIKLKQEKVLVLTEAVRKQAENILIFRATTAMSLADNLHPDPNERKRLIKESMEQMEMLKKTVPDYWFVIQKEQESVVSSKG